MSVRAGLAATLSAFGAAAATFCCIPILAAFLGAGGATLAATFAPLRFVFIAATLALLGYAFYSVYRRAACEGGCSVRSLRRQRLLVWLSAGIALAFITLEWWSAWVIYWLA